MIDFEGMQGGPDKPLVTIQFEWASPHLDEWTHQVVRHWYNVPRVGDSVTLTTPEGGSEHPTFFGKVRYVDWYDTHIAVGLE